MSFAASSEPQVGLASPAGAKPATFEVPAWLDALGGLVERNPQAWVRLGNWETRRLAEEIAGIVIDRPVYVTGLARSGSTILLELLAHHPDLATHRYRDFPLVFTPWLWSWFVDRAAGRPQAPRERAHQDGIAITPESPEAFEEMIWMAYFGHLHDPARCAVLDERTASPAFEAFYRDHIRKLLWLRKGRRYLAKGNYNVSRLAYLLKLFPDARFVVPVRDPVWHVASLMKQHALFSREESNDQRVLRHMRRAGHFEFGLGRRPINVGDACTASRVQLLWEAGNAVEGWAVYWSCIYGFLADLLEARPDVRAATLLVRYEDLCAQPADTMAMILEHCGLVPGDLPVAAEETIHPPDYYRPPFTALERKIIRDCTAATAARFGYAA